MSTTRPPESRERILSSRCERAAAGRSLVMTICRPARCSALKVWKKPSWVCSLPMMNWMSSRRMASADL